MNRNIKEIRDKIQENLNIWALVPLSLLERAQVAKNYIYAHLNFKTKTIDISNEVLTKIDNGIIKYL